MELRANLKFQVSGMIWNFNHLFIFILFSPCLYFAVLV